MVLALAGLGAQGPSLSLGLTLGPLYDSDKPGPGLTSSLKSAGVLVPLGALSLSPSSPAHSAAPPKVHRGIRAPHSRSPARARPCLFQVPQEGVTIFVSWTRAEPESTLSCVASESWD